MTTTALLFGCACLFVSGCFCGAATWHWLATRDQRRERRRQERDAHDARAFGHESQALGYEARAKNFRG